MRCEKTTKPFFQEYQKNNIMTSLHKTVTKILHEWLKTDDPTHKKLKSLHHLAEMSIDTNAFPQHEPLPDFVIRFWLIPHITLNALDSNISTEEIRKLIKEAAKQIELVKIHQKAPQY